MVRARTPRCCPDLPYRFTAGGHSLLGAAPDLYRPEGRPGLCGVLRGHRELPSAGVRSQGTEVGTWAKRHRLAFAEAKHTLRRLLPYGHCGARGTLIHGYIPTILLDMLGGSARIWAIPLTFCLGSRVGHVFRYRCRGHHGRRIRHERDLVMAHSGAPAIAGAFGLLQAGPACLPHEWTDHYIEQCEGV